MRTAALIEAAGIQSRDQDHMLDCGPKQDPETSHKSCKQVRLVDPLFFSPSHSAAYLHIIWLWARLHVENESVSAIDRSSSFTRNNEEMSHYYTTSILPLWVLSCCGMSPHICLLLSLSLTCGGLKKEKEKKTCTEINVKPERWVSFAGSAVGSLKLFQTPTKHSKQGEFRFDKH